LVYTKQIEHSPQKPRALPKLSFFLQWILKHVRLSQLLEIILSVWCAQFPTAPRGGNFGDCFNPASNFCTYGSNSNPMRSVYPRLPRYLRLLQLGVSNTFVALLDPLMPCSHAQDATISDHFDCWEIMREKRSPSPSGSHATPSRKRSSSDCSLSDLSPLCNRQLLKHFCTENDR